MPDEDKNFGGSLFWILESDDITIFTLSSNHGRENAKKSMKL